MHRLIEKGLMFGNLIRVDSPILVERYNRALNHLTGLKTEQEVFHIDISGYSPEIGDELEDDLYLNHKGVNRQFILLTTEQATAPLLNAKFSTSRSILRQFITENRAELFALTARDAVAGELVNSVYVADTPAKLFNIRKIAIEADTTSGTVATAKKLGAMIDRFKTEPNGWYDDVLIADMIGMAKKTGDVVRNPVALRQMTFGQENFWTDHFGGMYVFRGVAHPAAIVATQKDEIGALPIPFVFDFDDRSAIAKFLTLNDLVEPIMEARGVDSAAILHQKMDFIVASVAAEMKEDLAGATRRDLRRLGRQYADQLPEAWQGLAALLRWAEEDGPWPTITSEHPAYFYTLRAKAHPDADLVNMLLAELTPLDIRQLFICHKEVFYRKYADWSDEKRAYVVDFLDREYQVDKAGTREALFGHEDPMTEIPRIRQPDLITRVGPWGAVTRGRR
ncbi:DUF6638 family protein [Roseobacter sp. CCS2]|uniref:DUF6638 family protein n=1 Tax=Roseobacter sp. CCS2 TaxID=391593 RepID=UPI0000F404AA|nr:DUF6638 family protein [Roseobacter sp. CCS2]EBA13516.1 hypothetical protein RCCS2_06504 [Roseobacter sp. CCS2]